MGKKFKKGGIRERKTLGEQRKKVRQRDEKCSGEKGYLCLGVISTVGHLLKEAKFDTECER